MAVGELFHRLEGESLAKGAAEEDLEGGDLVLVSSRNARSFWTMPLARSSAASADPASSTWSGSRGRCDLVLFLEVHEELAGAGSWKGFTASNRACRLPPHPASPARGEGAKRSGSRASTRDG